MKKKAYIILIIVWLLILTALIIYANFSFVSVIFGVLIAIILIFFQRQIRKVI